MFAKSLMFIFLMLPLTIFAEHNCPTPEEPYDIDADEIGYYIDEVQDYIRCMEDYIEEIKEEYKEYYDSGFNDGCSDCRGT